ncbi:MAG: type II toxin-antitoxin system VapC family toxin [Gemmatimonadales bacterium]|nr:MAG: type II toxin-antitoxin system VapC family toxin [Gemmatimonadales bacterium]
MALIVADTDVLIDALRGRAPAARAIEDLLRSRRLATTAITRLELGVGAQLATQRSAVTALLATMPVLPLDAEAAAVAARVGASLRTAGKAIPMADLAIAGICLTLDLSLFTRNRRHFERIDGLRLVEAERFG